MPPKARVYIHSFCLQPDWRHVLGRPLRLIDSFLRSDPTANETSATSTRSVQNGLTELKEEGLKALEDKLPSKAAGWENWDTLCMSVFPLWVESDAKTPNS